VLAESGLCCNFVWASESLFKKLTSLKVYNFGQDFMETNLVGAGPLVFDEVAPDGFKEITFFSKSTGLDASNFFLLAMTRSRSRSVESWP
jgi:hypothetical protein